MQPTATTGAETQARPRAAIVSPWRRRIPSLVTLALVSGVGYAALHWVRSRPPPPTQYRTAKVARTPLTGKVIATGALSAIVTVQVGTQVSGRVQKLFVDFNSPVTKGQLVAKIDPQIYQAAADQAEANYLAAQAGVARAVADAKIADVQLARTRALHADNLAATADLDNAAAAAEAAHANADAARAALAQARAAKSQAVVNLSYTNIISPIDGVVISRSVDVGQTVAASLSAPTLFTIAQDLTKMQVDTSVAEADVGRLKVGMPTFFTVDAFPGRKFPGKVRQIRNAAVTVQNVVTYDAVIDVDNPDLVLRPGMTANVTVVYDERASALTVPNAALRFEPPGEAPSAPAGTKPVWILDAGHPRAAFVHIGLTDGTLTEVVDGDVKEGDPVILDVVDPAAAGASPSGGGASVRRLF